jgi:hypothetical protein
MPRRSRWPVEFACVILIAAAAGRTAAAQTVQSVGINQGIGVQKNGKLKFVAGKDIVVRAFMSAPVTGQILVTSALATGQHAITLTATNSGGVSTSKNVHVTVVPPRRRP